MNPSVDTITTAALKSLESGDAPAAMQMVLDALQWPNTLEADEFNHLMETLGKVGAKYRKLPFATALKEAARRPDDGKTIFTLGQALLEEGLFAPAATLLHRAYGKRRQHEETLAELVHALESMGRHADALEALQTADEELVGGSFTLTYLMAFNALMCCEVEFARDLLPHLVDEKDPDLMELAANLAEMLARVDAVAAVTPLDTQDIQGWHFVTTGGVLLHRSDEPTGRYVELEDSAAIVTTGISLLKDALAAAGLKPPQVVAPDDKSSVLLGQAVATSLGVPFKKLPANGTNEPALLVVYDLSLLDEKLVDVLQWHREGQPLFAHVSTWMEEPPFAADFTTALYGLLNPLDEDVLKISVTTEKEAETVKTLVTAAAKLQGVSGAGWLQKGGQRRRQRVESPVPRG